MGQVKAVIFDLDGTLLDTLEDIGNAMNEALAEMDFPTHDLSAYRQFVGDGVEVLAQRACPPDTPQAVLTRCFLLHREIYARRWREKTTPYPGVPEMLAKFAQAGKRMAVLSNKPHDKTVDCVRAYLGLALFDVVLGAGPDLPKKPALVGVRRILSQWRLPNEAVWYVGDTNTDMLTAKGAGLRAVGVTWGFRPRSELLASGADHTIDHADELSRLVLGV